MNDLTAIFYTSNTMPQEFADNVQAVLVESLGDVPVVSVSQKPMDFGTNVCVGDIGISAHNIYRQLLTGAKAAKTKYVVAVEDDVLYHPDHFKVRPEQDDIFTYDLNKMGVYTWSKKPSYSYKGRACLNQLICSRELLIEVLEERFASKKAMSAKCSHRFGEPGRYDREIGCKKQKLQVVRNEDTGMSVVFSHSWAIGFGYLGRRKRIGINPQTYLEPWGDVTELLKRIMGEEAWQKRL